VWNPPRIRPPLIGVRPAVNLPDETTGVTPIATAIAAEPDATTRRPWRAPRSAAEMARDEMLTVEYSYSRGELQPVLQAIRDTLGCGAVPLDTPDRLQEALATLIRSVAGAGDPSVRRSPAALLSPEYWHIRLDATDERTISTLAEVIGRRTTR
jgi:hypothetical protein